MSTSEEVNPFKEIERWVALLPSATERFPSVVEMTPDTYNAILRNSPPAPYWAGETSSSRFPVARAVVKPDLDVAWIVYDQHSVEMKRAER